MSGLSLADILPRLRCPRSGQPLERAGQTLRTADGAQIYPLEADVPDLRQAPERLQLDLPWFEPWQELDALRFDPPEPIQARDLPHHLDPWLASVPDERGDGRWVLEVGCGERQCEDWFSARDYRYVGADVDHRGIGPHVRVDAHNLPIVDDGFDLYLSLAVYEHLASPLLAAREGMRVLRPGGLFLGTAAFVYKFHDRASFHHMTHAGLLFTLRMAGFEVLRIWPDWRWTDAIPVKACPPGPEGKPWRLAASAGLKTLDWTFTRSSDLMRRLLRRPRLDRRLRDTEMAGSLSFVARKPGGEAPRG